MNDKSTRNVAGATEEKASNGEMKDKSTRNVAGGTEEKPGKPQ
jgi:hypothetical protein